MKTKPDSMVEKVKAFIRMPYAWPGGYPLYAITSDGASLCKTCGKNHAKTLIDETRQNWFAVDRNGKQYLINERGETLGDYLSAIAYGVHIFLNSLMPR